MLRTIRRIYYTVRRILSEQGVNGLFKATITEVFPSLASRLIPKPKLYLLKELLPLEITTYSEAEVTIIIPVYNQSVHTYNCLRSISLCSDKTKIKIIVVNDCSTDNTLEMLRLITGISVINNDENMGFILSCNKAALTISSPYILFLNNDIIVTDHWLERLHDTLIESQDIGLVGSKLIYPDGRLQEAGGIVWNDGSGYNYGKGKNPLSPDYNFIREVDYVSGACILIPTYLFNEVGKFDEQYVPAYYEDTDLAFSIRKKGLKVIYQPLSQVYHFEGASNGTKLSEGLKQYQVRNQKLFISKWSEELTYQSPPLYNPDVNIINHTEEIKKILIIDSKVPSPSEDSGSFRMYHFIKILINLGYDVSFIPDNLDGRGEDTAGLIKLGVKVIYAPFYSIHSYLKKYGGLFSIVILSRLKVAKANIRKVKKYTSAKIIFDTVDLHHIREQRAAKISNNFFAKMSAQQTKKEELAMIKSSNICLVVSHTEKTYLQKEMTENNICILSNIHPLHRTNKTFGQRKDILFVGSFEHPPNVDAVIYFTEHIFPLIIKNNPEICLNIVGSKMPNKIEILKSENINIHGYVKDLEPLLERCKLSIAPLRFGAGVKGKINLSMSYGLPVVMSEVAAEGMMLQDGFDAMIANSYKDFATKLIKLYDNEQLWNKLSTNGYHNIKSNFSVEKAEQCIKELHL